MKIFIKTKESLTLGTIELNRTTDYFEVESRIDIYTYSLWLLESYRGMSAESMVPIINLFMKIDHLPTYLDSYNSLKIKENWVSMSDFQKEIDFVIKQIEKLPNIVIERHI